MNNFLKNLGILLIVLGTAVLVLSYVCNWLDYNWPYWLLWSVLSSTLS